MIHDFLLAVKHLRRSPLFVVVAVVTLGLGIGLTTTMLTMLDTILHPYVAYREPDRLYGIVMWGDGGSRKVTSVEKYQVLTQATQSFEDIAAAVEVGGLVLAEAYGNAAQVPRRQVTGNYFQLLGMKPEMGRFFADGPSAPDENKVVVSYSLWQQLLLSKPLTQDLHVTIDGLDYSVIGVMPPEQHLNSEILLRLPGEAGVSPNERRYIAPMVRLKPGLTEPMVYNELNLLASRLTAAYGEGRQKFQFRLYPMEPPDKNLSEVQVAMGGAALAVLLIACANLANLMLARGLNRRKELALRLALGARRGDLIRQLLIESSVVGALGGALGTMLSVWGVGLVRLELPANARWIGFLSPRLDWRVYAFALATTVLAVLVFGLWPALTASDVSVSEPLKEGGTNTTRSKHRYSGLVIAEVAICLVVVMAAGLLVRQLNVVKSIDPGFERQGLLRGNINLSRLNIPSDSAVERTFFDLRNRLRQVPGVLEVAMSAGGRAEQGALTSDLEGAEPKFIVALGYQTVTPEFVRTMGYRVIAGRDFSPGDRQTGPVAIVDDIMADRLWPGASPIGRMLKLGGPSSNAPWVRVVGLLRGQRLPQVNLVPPGQLFVMLPKELARMRSILVRASGNSAVVASGLRRKIAETFPGGVWGGGYFYDSDRSYRESLQAGQFITGLFTGLGGLSLVLAGVGLYGVLAYSVGQRMREFGIRIALGAANRSVFKLVLHDAAVMILAGTAIGCWFAMWAGTLMVNEDTSVIAPTDWIALASGEVVLLIVCFAACLTPAIKASKANPLDIIRAI